MSRIPQSEVQMAIWSIAASPLLMSNDLRSIDDASKAVLQNAEVCSCCCLCSIRRHLTGSAQVIAVNQDPLGAQGIRISESPDGGQVWRRVLANADVGGL